MDKTIQDYEEVTELADDDYIVLDSENGGPCKILANEFKNIVNPGGVSNE